MALHFEPEEFAARRDRLILKMEEEAGCASAVRAGEHVLADGL